MNEKSPREPGAFFVFLYGNIAALMDPFLLLRSWFMAECALNQGIIPEACCLSTIGTDGYPNARFVALKDVSAEGCLLAGPMDTRKGREMAQDPRVALTCWWPATRRQVRIQGNAEMLPAELSDHLFGSRSREARLVSVVSAQGQPLSNPDALHQRYAQAEAALKGQAVPRPEAWQGMLVRPVRIEFMTFSESRFHDRVLYSRSGDTWSVTPLQP